MLDCKRKGKGNIMHKRELYELFEEMINVLGEKGLLDEIFNVLSSDELEENLKYIADNNDLNDLYKK